MERRTKNDFTMIKKMLTEERGLAHNAKDEDDILTTDAS